MEKDSEELLMSMLHEPELYRKIRKEIEDSQEEEEKEGSVMCKAFDEMREKYRNVGYAEGIMEGQIKGENVFAALISAMTKDGRASELPRLGEEPEFLKEMKEVYHLQEIA
ncbi:MAG: hypothetical protein KHY93_14545 [Clostridiales bacterium]|nr:hypothetical protein [Clostridiales bacterium]